MTLQTDLAIMVRLEELRKELRAGRISYGELAELQSLSRYIAPDDVELLEAAGLPEYPEPTATGMTPTEARELADNLPY